MIIARKNLNTYTRLPNLYKSKLIAIGKPSNNENDTSVLHSWWCNNRVDKTHSRKFYFTRGGCVGPVSFWSWSLNGRTLSDVSHLHRISCGRWLMYNPTAEHVCFMCRTDLLCGALCQNTLISESNGGDQNWPILRISAFNHI